MARPEARLEELFKTLVEEAGGAVRKLVTPGRRHAPDRLVIIPGDRARVVFVELKAPGKKPRAGQLREHKRLRDLGCDVEVISTHEELFTFLGAYL